MFLKYENIKRTNEISVEWFLKMKGFPFDRNYLLELELELELECVYFQSK